MNLQERIEYVNKLQQEHEKSVQEHKIKTAKFAAKLNHTALMCSFVAAQMTSLTLASIGLVGRNGKQ